MKGQYLFSHSLTASGGSFNSQKNEPRIIEDWKVLLEEKIEQGHHSTKTIIPAFRGLHHQLSRKYRWYHQWHTWKLAPAVHALLLFLVIATGTYQGFKIASIKNPTEKVHAGNYCQSTGGGGNWSSASSWTNCSGGYPQTSDSVEIMSGDTITLDIDSWILSLTIDEGGTFDASSNTLSLAGIGTPLTVLGTFNASTSTIKYLGAGDVTVTATSYNNLSTVPNMGKNSYTVSGAGNSAYNGTYTKTNDFYNDYPIYTNGTKDMVAHPSTATQGDWDLTENNLYEAIAYSVNTTNLSIIPDSGWTVIEGVAPAPTMATVDGGTVTYTFSSGSISVGGDYVNGNTACELITDADSNNPVLGIIGSFTNSINATFIAPSATSMLVAGDWTNSGTFTHSSGTVVLYGVSQTISGETTFYNLSNYDASDLTILFASGTTQTIENVFTMVTTSGHNITLGRSGGSGTDQWHITMAANTLAYVTIENSYNTTGVGQDTANTTDGGNNTNWFSTSSTPTPPSGSSIGSIDTTSFTVSWTDNSSDETGFKLYISTTAAADCSTATYPGTPDYTPAADATSQAVTGKSVNTQYCSKVVATNAGGDSSAAYSSPAYTLANAPSAPTVNTATTSSLAVIINVNSNPSATEFAIYNDTTTTYVQADGTLGASAIWQDYTTWGGSSGIVNTGLTSSTSYTYKVKARNGDSTETSLSSSTALSTSAASTTTPASTPASTSSSSDLTPPVAPTNLATSNICSTTALVSWTAATGADTYTVSYGTDAAASNIDTTSSLTTTSTSFSNLSNNITYYWKARSTSTANGTGAYSTPVSFTTSSCVLILSAPSNFAGTALSTTEINWQWSDNSISETGWNVLDTTGKNLSGNLAANTKSWNETGLSPNTVYTRLVNIFNSTSNNNSNQSTVYSLANTPGAPRLSAVAPDQINITIDTNDNPDANTRYAIAVSSNDGTTWSYVKHSDHKAQDNPDWQLYSDWGGDNGFTATNLSSATTYTYKVKAENGDNVATGFGLQATLQTPSPVISQGTGLQTIQKSTLLGKVWTQLKEKPVETSSVSIIASLVAAIAAAIAASLANTLTLLSFPEYIRSTMFFFLSAIRPKKDKQDWGKVTESGTGLAIPQVKIDLVKLDKTITGSDERKIVQTMYSDADGQYAFIAPPGRYTLDIHKDMYNVSTNSSAYHEGTIIDVADVNNSLVAPDIALSMNTGVVGQKATTLHRSDILEKSLRYFSFVCLAFGSYVTVSGLITHPENRTNIIIAPIYPFLWYLNLRSAKRVSPFGDVVDTADSKGIPLTLIRIMDEDAKRMVKTAVTDKEGHFQAILSKGVYKMLAAKTGYRQSIPQTVLANENLNVLSKRIELERGENVPTAPTTPPVTTPAASVSPVSPPATA